MGKCQNWRIIHNKMLAELRVPSPPEMQTTRNSYTLRIGSQKKSMIVQFPIRLIQRKRKNRI